MVSIYADVRPTLTILCVQAAGHGGHRARFMQWLPMSFVLIVAGVIIEVAGWKPNKQIWTPSYVCASITLTHAAAVQQCRSAVDSHCSVNSGSFYVCLFCLVAHLGVFL